jgi:hypothetical protein
VEIIFGRRVRCDTPGTFRTAIDRLVIDPDDKGVVVNISCKHSRVKQYLKQGQAMRIETVINCPRDLACNARLPNLAELQDKARAINRRILEAERAGQATVLASPAFERIAHPSADADGRRTPALRFGDPRVTALAGPLAATLTAATGITNKSLRALTTGLLHAPYTPGQMTYDLRRLRLAGLISRIEHTHTYVLTPTASSSPSSTPSSTTGCSARSWPPTSHRHPPNSATPSTSSASTSMTTSAEHASAKPRENLTQTPRS